MTPRTHDRQTATETFGLSAATPHLIAKLRNMEPDLLKTIRTSGAAPTAPDSP